MCILHADKRPITVAAQRWTCTSFHLYALASGLAGRLDNMNLSMCGVSRVNQDYSTIRSNDARVEGASRSPVPFEIFKKHRRQRYQALIGTELAISVLRHGSNLLYRSVGVWGTAPGGHPAAPKNTVLCRAASARSTAQRKEDTDEHYFWGLR